MPNATATAPFILLYVNEIFSVRARSGVQRVTLRLASELASRCCVDLVRWNAQEGGLRFCDRSEFNQLFGAGAWPHRLQPRLEARSVGRPFRELLGDTSGTWFLSPEIPYHSPQGQQAFATAVSQMRESGIACAQVFYDNIPVNTAAYADARARHLRYLADLARTDLVLPISSHMASELRRFYTAAGLDPALICPIPLGESERAEVARPEGAQERHIVMIGTVEPRKRQIGVVRAYARARRTCPALATLPIIIIGSLHPAVAAEFERLVAETPGVEYRAYLADAELERVWRDAAFSVFASDDEGYGLPVAESLTRGVPCLAADVAPITEIAGGRGVLHVDVTSEDALCAGLTELAQSPQLRETLRSDMASRPLRTWGDYADDVLRVLSQAGPARRVAPARPVVIAQAGAPLAEVARADIGVVSDDDARDALVAAAAEHRTPELLPHRLLVDPAGALLELEAFRRRLTAVAQAERAYGQAWRALSSQWAARPVRLRIVISTYNRRDFVMANVQWLLDRVIRGQPDVGLMVVDNASTDGTAEALERFAADPVQVIVNPANTGMLGNMRVCAQIPGAEYVWLIGDDDFIVPEAVEALLSALKGPAGGVPLVYLNFAVYHREALRPGDTAQRLQAEGVPLAPVSLESGLIPVSLAAAQHDNLFTAIYINIWRSDVLAAAYDHAFNGAPFASLIESIPCTKTLLETYGESPAWWHQPVAIVGNAHNSWVRHRPRWHALLMPRAIHLARDAGVDPVVLQRWMDTHAGLFDEARAMAMEAGRGLNMDEPGAFDLSWPSFRRRLETSAGERG